MITRTRGRIALAATLIAGSVAVAAMPVDADEPQRAAPAGAIPAVAAAPQQVSDDATPPNPSLSTVVTDRFADTRAGATTVDGDFAGDGRIAARGEYEVQIAGRGDVPEFAVGAIVEVTMVGPSGPGFATVHPCGTTPPTASAINYTTGVDVANEVFADLSADGSLCVYTYEGSHLLIDVVGYVLPFDSVKLMTPARLAESRIGAPTIDGESQGFGRTTPGSTTTVKVTGRANVPTGISAAILNVAAVDPADNGFISVNPCLPGSPTASSINYAPGVNRANELIAQVDAEGDVCIYTQHAVDLIVDVVGYVEEGSDLVSMSPVRFAETRVGAPTVDGQSQGGGALAAGSSTTIQITGRSTVPAGAVAAVVNVAAVDPQAAGFFTVDGCNTPRPNASSLNYTPGVNGANELVVQLNADGELCVYTSASTDMILDVVGYIVERPLTVTLLHINDHHSNLLPTNNSLNLGTTGGAFTVPFGGFPRITAKMAELEAQRNVVKIHAGDAITGTLFYTLFQGEADAAMMNTVCFDMFALGNHEFDDGDATLVQFLDFLADDPDCDTATIAANVVPEIGTPLAPVNQDDYIQPYVIREFGGEQVGFIGIDVADKTMGSSQPDPTTQFLDEVETTQQYVDELADMGIGKVVVVTHYGYQNDLALAAAVTGIDAIVGGDSHSLLGDFGAFGLPSQGAYPTVVTNLDGDDVCVVQAWQYSWVVGELSITFNDDDTMASCGGTPHLLLGDSFTRGSPAVAVDEPERSEILAAIAATPELSVVTPDPAAAALLQVFADQVAVLSEQVIGTAQDLLCARRVPNTPQGTGDCAILDYAAPSGARLDINGGFIQQIVSDAFLARSFQADLALQNGGGVRVTQAAGNVTIGDVYTILPFNNTLVNLTLSGAEVKQSVEDALNRYAANPGSNTGAFPYGSGIRWAIDMTAANDERVTNIEVRNRTTGVWGPIDLAASYTVVTNSFLAGGGDGAVTFKAAADDGRIVDTFINYAQGLFDYIEQDLGGGPIVVPAPAMFSTQSFVPLP